MRTRSVRTVLSANAVFAQHTPFINAAVNKYMFYIWNLIQNTTAFYAMPKSLRVTKTRFKSHETFFQWADSDALLACRKESEMGTVTAYDHLFIFASIASFLLFFPRFEDEALLFRTVFWTHKVVCLIYSSIRKQSGLTIKTTCMHGRIWEPVIN